MEVEHLAECIHAEKLGAFLGLGGGSVTQGRSHKLLMMAAAVPSSLKLD